jgi:hypothetical protein
MLQLAGTFRMRLRRDGDRVLAAEPGRWMALMMVDPSAQNDDILY